MKWKDIKGFEGLYKVSNTGKVKSVKRFCKTGNSTRTVPEKLLSIKLDKDGYETVGLSKNNKVYYKKVHRLVAIAFISNPKKLPQINHEDGIKTNNNVNNLIWCDASYNINHSFRTRLNTNQEGKHNLGVLTEKKVVKIRKLLETTTMAQVARKFNVTHKTIRDIKNFKTWKYIGE